MITGVNSLAASPSILISVVTISDISQWVKIIKDSKTPPSHIIAQAERELEGILSEGPSDERYGQATLLISALLHALKSKRYADIQVLNEKAYRIGEIIQEQSQNCDLEPEEKQDLYGFAEELKNFDKI